MWHLVNYQHQDHFPNKELIIPARTPAYREYAWYMDLSRKIRAGDIDLLHNSTAHLTRGGFAVPYVATVMDLIPLVHPEFMTRSQTLLWKFFAKGSFKSADRLIAISHSTKRDLIEYCSIPEENITVVYPGISPIFRRFSFNHSQIEQQYNIREPFVLYVGSIDPRKNIEVLIRAFRQVDQKYQLVIAGRMGWKMEPPAALAERYGVSGRVKWLGYVPEEDKVKLYNMASCLVFPSLYEGYGLPPAEAMACGCPVVCSDRGSLPEVVNENNGFVVHDIEEELPGTIAEAVVSERRVTTGPTWGEAAKRICRIYQEVLESHNSESL
jgi:alpha-1,3-rhamnosyl/mannosyltransferase